MTSSRDKVSELQLMAAMAVHPLRSRMVPTPNTEHMAQTLMHSSIGYNHLDAVGQGSEARQSRYKVSSHTGECDDKNPKNCHFIFHVIELYIMMD